MSQKDRSLYLREQEARVVPPAGAGILRKVGVDVDVGQDAVPSGVIRSDSEGIAERFAPAVPEAWIGRRVPAETCLCFNFSCVCPEPVLENIRALVATNARQRCFRTRLTTRRGRRGSGGRSCSGRRALARIA